MSYGSFTLRKPKRKKEIVTFFEDNTNSIYSTLSKKPAGIGYYYTFASNKYICKYIECKLILSIFSF